MNKDPKQPNPNPVLFIDEINNDRKDCQAAIDQILFAQCAKMEAEYVIKNAMKK